MSLSFLLLITFTSQLLRAKKNPSAFAEGFSDQDSVNRYGVWCLATATITTEAITTEASTTDATSTLAILKEELDLELQLVAPVLQKLRLQKPELSKHVLLKPEKLVDLCMKGINALITLHSKLLYQLSAGQPPECRWSP